MATTFGTRPEDTVADSRGNVQPGVVIQLYPTKTDATNKTALIASVTTDAKGLYSYSDASSRTGLWARDPSGRVWSINPEEFGSSVDANTAAIATKADGAATTASLATKVAKGELVFNVKDYGAVADCNGTQGNGTDNLAAFNAAITAANAVKGRVYVPPGVYRCSGQLSVTYWLYGAGGGQPAVSGSAATTIVFDSSVSGVALTGIASHLEAIYLRGGGGTTNDGVTIQNTWTVTRDVSIKGFSRHGYNCDTSVSGIYDQGQVDVLHVYNCGGNGVNIVGGADSNAGTYKAVDCVTNTGWGIWVQNAARNNFIGGHLSGNTAGGIHDDGNSNVYDVYVEGGTGNTLDFGASSSYGVYIGRYYAMPPLTGSYINAMVSGWEIHDSGTIRGQVVVRDSAQASSTKWGMRVGSYSAGWMEIVQLSSGVRLVRVDSTLAASYWNTHFRSETSATFDIGSSANGWRDLYANQQVRPSATKTANYTLTSADNIVIYNGTSLTATLPDPTTAGLPGRVFLVKNINSSSLTVNSAGSSKTLDGAASQALAQWAKASYTSDGTQWLTLS